MKRTFLFRTAIAAAVLFQTAMAQNASPYWSLAGNSNATASSKLGTTNGVSLRFFAGNVQRMMIGYATGNVAIGTTALRGKLTVLNVGGTPAPSWVTSSGTPLFTGFSEGTSGNGDYLFAMASGSGTVRPILIGRRSRGTLAAPAAVSNNDNLTSFLASGYDGRAFQNPASLEFLADGTPASGSVPARIAFYTGANTATRAERLRITSTGNVGIGTATPLADYQLHVANTANGIYGESIAEDPDFPWSRRGIGVTGRGNIGAQGRGQTGVKGIGSADGTAGIGVDGEGIQIGVLGTSIDGTGMRGEGATGIVADGGEVGLVASALPNNYGIGIRTVGFIGIEAFTTSNSDAYAGNFTTGDNGTGVQATGGVYAGAFYGDVYASGAYQTSDKNLKQHVTALEGALAIISKLKPTNYEFKTDARLAALRLPKGNHYGLLAQDVEEVLPGLVKETKHNIAALQPGNLPSPSQPAKQKAAATEMVTVKAVNYTELIPILVKGMQELNEKDKELDALRSEVTELRKMVLELKQGKPNPVTLAAGYLEQNNPNPVRGTTTIRYHIPETAASARLSLINQKGQVVKTIAVTGFGTGQTNVTTDALPAGTYNYTLYVDGKPVDTKRLVIVR